MEICRGDMFYADLSPAIGEEMGGTRLVITLQNDCLNTAVSAEKLKTITIAPITSAVRPEMDPRWIVNLPREGLFDHKIDLSQIRTISVQRLREFFDKATPNVMTEVDQKLKLVLGL